MYKGSFFHKNMITHLEARFFCLTSVKFSDIIGHYETDWTS